MVKFWKPIVVLAALCLAVAPVLARGGGDKAEQEQGTTAEELAKLKLSQPSTLKVLVLPFWDYSSKVQHQRMASGASWMFFQRQGFQMLPITTGFDLVAKDQDLEPGLPMRKTDAVRLGKAAGANWVVYGEVKELRAYKKEAVFKRSKNMAASMRLAVADVATEQTFYYKVRSDKIGGTGLFGGFQKSADSMALVAVMSISNKSLQPLFDAMPQHPVSDKMPGSGDLAKFIDQTWPEKK